MKYIKRKKSEPNKRKIRDLAGAWKMSDEEVKDLFESLRKGWNKTK